MVGTWHCITTGTSTILPVYSSHDADLDRLFFCQRDFEVGRHRVTTRARLLQLHQDVLVVLAVDVDLVAIILLNGEQLPLRVSSKHLIDRDIGVSLFVPLVSHLLLVDVIDVLRHVRFVFSRSRGQVWNCPSPSADVQLFVGLVIGCLVVLATYVPHDEVRVHPLWVRCFHPLWARSLHPLWVRSFHPLWVCSFGFLSRGPSNQSTRFMFTESVGFTQVLVGAAAGLLTFLFVCHALA